MLSFSRDARLLLPISLLCSIALWFLAPLLLVPTCVLLALVAWYSATSGEVHKTFFPFRAWAFFLIFWLLFKFGADMLGSWAQDLPLPWRESLGQCAILALRLAGMAALSLCVVSLASALHMGKALAWYLRPILRTNAWQPALALMLMLRFLPQCFAIILQSRRLIRLRCQHFPFHQRMALLGSHVLCQLARLVDKQAQAVTLRQLDRNAAWRIF